MKHTNEDLEKLFQLFDELNRLHFDNLLDKIQLKFTGRLRSTGGQYFSKPRKLIQISTRYLKMENAWLEIRDTLGHEMVHYWLDYQGKPCGHTSEFKAKIKECGFQRYSRLTPVKSKYQYECPSCKLIYNRRKKGIWSCGPCSGPKFDMRFKLQLISQDGSIPAEKKKIKIPKQLKLFFGFK